MQSNKCKNSCMVSTKKGLLGLKVRLKAGQKVTGNIHEENRPLLAWEGWNLTHSNETQHFTVCNSLPFFLTNLTFHTIPQVKKGKGLWPPILPSSSPIFRGGNGTPERLSNLPKAASEKGRNIADHFLRRSVKEKVWLERPLVINVSCLCLWSPSRSWSPNCSIQSFLAYLLNSLLPLYQFKNLLHLVNIEFMIQSRSFYYLCLSFVQNTTLFKDDLISAWYVLVEHSWTLWEVWNQKLGTKSGIQIAHSFSRQS